MDEAELARQMKIAELENAEIPGMLDTRLFTHRAYLEMTISSLISGDD
jgi:hypothetical protein